MIDRQAAHWESRMAQTAAEFSYPATPDLRADVLARIPPAPTRQRARRLAWALMALLLVLAGLLTVPPVRATVRETVQQLWQIGAVRLHRIEPATPTVLQPTPQATPLPAYPPLTGSTTLQAARGQVSFPIPLPGYPADLGEPDAVFVQQMNGPVVILVWMQPDDNQTVAMSLTIFDPSAFAAKSLMPYTLVQETIVHDTPALWVQGEHVLQFQNEGFQSTQLVEGNVLIWTGTHDDGTITYRLESGLGLDEAVCIAESLH